MKTALDVINECKKLSFEDRSSFPEVVKRLKEVGIGRYYVDLVRSEATYYGENLESYRIEFPIPNLEGITEIFSEVGIKDAVRAIQKGEIDYATFLSRAMKSGMVAYIAFLKGAQVHYIGAKGDTCIEYFPSKK